MVGFPRALRLGADPITVLLHFRSHEHLKAAIGVVYLMVGLVGSLGMLELKSLNPKTSQAIIDAMLAERARTAEANTIATLSDVARLLDIDAGAFQRSCPIAVDETGAISEIDQASILALERIEDPEVRLHLLALLQMLVVERRSGSN